MSEKKKCVASAFAIPEKEGSASPSASEKDEEEDADLHLQLCDYEKDELRRCYSSSTPSESENKMLKHNPNVACVAYESATLRNNKTSKKLL